MKKSAINLLGIPYDNKSSFLRGSAQAPSIIRQILHNTSSSYVAENGVDIMDDVRLEDLGDLKVQNYLQISHQIKALQKSSPFIFLGGDHSITYQTVIAMNEKHGPFDILVFDAHTDLYDNFQGDRYSHACPFARIMEDNLAGNLIQVGIRTVNAHQWEQAHKYGVEVITMREIDRLSQLSLTNPLYISIDLDAFDPAFAPGVSHHEPGGLTPREVINFLHKIDAPIIGADIVEYNPTRDHQNITAALAAKLLKELTGIMAAS
ncbi:MAG: agmatinase [Bacteroidia bacterium]